MSGRGVRTDGELHANQQLQKKATKSRKPPPQLERKRKTEKRGFTPTQNFDREAGS